MRSQNSWNILEWGNIGFKEVESRGEKNQISPSSPLEIFLNKSKSFIIFPHHKVLTRIHHMAPSSPTHTTATRKPSRLSIINDGIHKHDHGFRNFDHLCSTMSQPPTQRPDCEVRKALQFQLNAMRLSPHFPHFHATDMRRPESAPSSQQASNTDAATERRADFAETPEVFSWQESDFEDADCWRSPTSDDSEPDETTLWSTDNTATRQPPQGDRLGSLEMYWSPWESELLQDEFWDSGSDVESDAAGM